jgi:PAS domain S-box-containing protein
MAATPKTKRVFIRGTVKRDEPLTKKRVQVVAKSKGKKPNQRQDDGLARNALPETGPYRDLLQSVYDAVLITSPSGRIIDANPRSAHYLLFSRSELCTMNMTEIVAGADRSLLRSVAVNAQDQRYTLIDARCRRKDGSMFAAEIAASGLEYRKQIHLCFFIRDLTVRNQAETALKEALQQLERHDRERSLFVSSVSHELRTPLTSITYAVANLLKGVVGDVPENIREYLEKIDRESKRLLSTVNDILDLEKMATGSLRLAKGKVPLARLVSRSVESFELLAKHKNITLTADIAGVTGFVFCDMPKMERALMNIVGNALKYTPEGGTVTVTAREDAKQKSEFVISVLDTGIGIPPHALRKVKDRYYRAGEHADGAGLGLTIACEIVEQHGGAVSVQSPPPGADHGTRVCVELASANPPTILVVSSDKTLVEDVEAGVVPCGYRVSTSPSAEDTLELIRGGRPVDLALIDSRLPGMSGVQMVLAMRSDDKATGVPVIVMAGKDINAAGREVLSGLSVPTLPKLAREAQLLDAIQHAIIERRMEVEETEDAAVE